MMSETKMKQPAAKIRTAAEIKTAETQAAFDKIKEALEPVDFMVRGMTAIETASGVAFNVVLEKSNQGKR